MKTLDEKYEALKRFIKNKGKNGVVVAFSGGVDSVTLAAICQSILIDRVVAVTAESPTYTSEVCAFKNCFKPKFLCDFA